VLALMLRAVGQRERGRQRHDLRAWRG
jgi:hypothetical protein